jgi:hypothetical protein
VLVVEEVVLMVADILVAVVVVQEIIKLEQLPSLDLFLLLFLLVLGGHLVQELILALL